MQGQSSAHDLKLPDPATGSINGRSALLFWPVLLTDDPNEPTLLSPQGCRIYLIPLDDPTIEHRYDCGKWFQPPKGRYNAWLETADRISSPWTVIYGGAFSKGGLGALTPVFPAGRVAIPVGRSLANGEELRILSLDNHRTTSSGRIFERRVRREDAGKPVMMPAGRIIVGRFDKKSGDAIALSRPAPLETGRIVRVWPEPPVDGSDLLLILRKPPRTGEADDTLLFVDDGQRRRAADVALDVNRIIAIWYGIDARNVTVSLRAQKVMWPAREVRLLARRVSTIRSQAERPPKLGVSVNAPDTAMLPDALPVTVARLEDERLVAKASIDADHPHQFEDLPADAYRVTLTVDDWRFFKEVDLSTGDGDVVFDLEPITIHGNVFLGDEPAAAELRFHNHDEWVNVRTDDSGAYRATVWHPGYYSIRIAISDSDRAPFTQHFTAIRESGRRDFRLPLTNYALTVSDAETGAPVAGAKVNLGNVWLDETGVEQSLLDTLVTGESGSITLSPLRAGRLFLTVSAKGYAEGRLERTVLPDDRQRHELTVPLQQLRASHRLRLIAATGEPLAAAEIWAFTGQSFAVPLWQGTTDGDGLVDVADRLQDAMFLIRHSKIASVARQWTGGTSDVVEWRMDAPAPPLTTTILRPGGDQARSARIAIWLDGVRLSGVPLTFATWSSPAADPQGRWVARNLPRKPTRVLALPLSSSSSIEAHTFDGMATMIPFPWTSPTPVTTVE